MTKLNFFKRAFKRGEVTFQPIIEDATPPDDQSKEVPKGERDDASSKES